MDDTKQRSNRITERAVNKSYPEIPEVCVTRNVT